MFVRNCWYVIAWDHEVPDDGLFSRTVLGEAILLYRTAGGEITALRDRCCHRLAPLSKGRKEGDCVRCGYHGLLFDATGRCIEIPGSETVPAKARVQRYPLAVKNKWVFVWMGDPAKADPALLPDNFSCDHPDWDYVPGYMHYATPQQLICDNLLDFSHLSYVHEKTLGGTTAIAQARAEIETVPRGIRVTRKVHDVPPPPYYRAVRQLAGQPRPLVHLRLRPPRHAADAFGRPSGRRLRGRHEPRRAPAQLPDGDAGNRDQRRTTSSSSRAASTRATTRSPRRSTRRCWSRSRKTGR